MSQLALIPGPTLAANPQWRCKRCDCQKPQGSVPCGSCPFTVAWPGLTQKAGQ